LAIGFWPDKLAKEQLAIMKRVFLIGGTVGFLVAFTAGCVWYYLYYHGLADTGGARLFGRISEYAWPTGIMLMDADQADFGSILLLLISSIGNGVIYGIVACCIYFGWRKILAIGN
jgi:hypothetical protein